MARKRKKPKTAWNARPASANTPFLPDFERAYQTACSSAMTDNREEARRQYQDLFERVLEAKSRALIENDLGTLAALEGEFGNARLHFETALKNDPACQAATENLALLNDESAPTEDLSVGDAANNGHSSTAEDRVKIAILSLLFNWPSTGGGTIHTAELGRFLGRAGYDVRHIYAQYADWGVGNVMADTDVPSTCLSLDATTWHAPEIQRRFRHAVDEFRPDLVIITDSWNFKPLLAEAVQGYRYFLRLAAQECLCPLNNVRLLVNNAGAVATCPKHQLATPDACRQCVAANGRFSGGLHQAERALSDYGSSEYDRQLRGAFANAEGVLVVNPQIAAMVGPYAKAVHVVPSGFDSSRFPWPWPTDTSGAQLSGKTKLLFAGLTHEFMKGYHVLWAACQKLWEKRQDFELVVTADAAGESEPFARYIGWQSQDDLPRHLRAADILVFPTIAEEALGRSAVEAMAVGRPVIASRIGGLPYTVTDGLTGLLFEPRNADDLAGKIERLLDDPALRERLGRAGREQFETRFTWETIIAQHYRRLFGPSIQRESPHVSAAPRSRTLAAVGCVLAIQNRPVDMLERCLQTYAYQSLQPADKVLLDYGSAPDMSDAYARLCRAYGWRMVHARGHAAAWCLSHAYNLAISALDPAVEVVFKDDVDMLLGSNVLETAALLGRDRLCLFPRLTTLEGTIYPAPFVSHQSLLQLLESRPFPVPMEAEGTHACPRKWFEEISGFDLNYWDTGYEDSDLRLRAQWSIGIERPTNGLLIRQWHPPEPVSEQFLRNRAYYESTKPRRQVVRNGGRLVPPGVTFDVVLETVGERTAPAHRSDTNREPTGNKLLNAALVPLLAESNH